MEYRLTRRIAGKGGAPHQFQHALRGVTVSGDRLLVVGDSVVKVFDDGGNLVGQWPTRLPAECVAVDGRGRVWVGERAEVEVFRPDGSAIDTWRDPAGFSGCCNPTNLTLDVRGRVIVSEKAAPRVKVYDPAGTLLVVVADAVFGTQAKNMDLAVDAKGRIYVADTASLAVCVFTPGGEGAAA